MREVIRSFDKKFRTFAFVAVLAVIATYSVPFTTDPTHAKQHKTCWHFSNDFHFDDSHTIFNNMYIRDINNIPLFFRDARTTSSFPPNQAYRPGLTTLNAIDLWITKSLGGDITKPKPFVFHVSIFIGYLLLGFFLFFVVLDIFNRAFESEWNKYAALFLVTWFWLHVANAETINYIIARSDSFSTLMIIIAFTTYIYKPKWRSKFIYLIPMVIGFTVKEPSIMFVPLLLLYIVLIERQHSLSELFSKIKPIFNDLWKTAAVGFGVAVFLYWFSQKMTPPTWSPGELSRFGYAITQPFVIFHYFGNFILPIDLSVDTDWEQLKSVVDIRFIVGLLFVCGMLYAAFKTSEKKETRPIAFGILWFFVALLPTSSFIPLSEVLNDHRPFFPYIGLFIAATNLIYLFVIRRKEKFAKVKSSRDILFAGIFILLGAHAFGTFKRNQVWHSELSLWYDCSIKSPKNGRGLMNYGLALMNEGERDTSYYRQAKVYFKKGIELWPQYSYLYINMAMCNFHMNDTAAAEINFKNAIGLETKADGTPRSADPLYFYAQYLCGRKRFDEAIPLLRSCMKVSNSHMYARYVLMNVFADKYMWPELDSLVAQSVAMFPKDAEVLKYVDIARNRKTLEQRQVEAAQSGGSAQSYIDLSLTHFNQGRYKECIDACNQALKMDPNNADAYNNICCSYNQMGMWDEALKAAEMSMKLRPGFDVAERNYKNIKDRNERVYKAVDDAKKNPTAEKYLAVSTLFFEGLSYDNCIKYANEALKLRPNYADAYNNICAANSKLKNWDAAKSACDQALRLNPGMQVARTNLQYIEQQRGAK